MLVPKWFLSEVSILCDQISFTIGYHHPDELTWWWQTIIYGTSNKTSKVFWAFLRRKIDFNIYWTYKFKERETGWEWKIEKRKRWKIALGISISVRFLNEFTKNLLQDNTQFIMRETTGSFLIRNSSHKLKSINVFFLIYRYNLFSLHE